MTLRIMYGVQGTGNGHITRARAMANAFNKRDDIHVDFLFSGRPAEKYFDMEVFGDYQTRHGLTFVHSNGAVSQVKTVMQAKPLQLLKDVKQLDLGGYDLVLNDFEPITAWAAKRQGITSISISHQAAFATDVPKAGQSFADKIIMRLFAPTTIKFGVHWYHFGNSIMPPFIEDKAENSKQGSYYLVYLPFESTRDITVLLESLSEHNFVCYHPDVEQDYDSGHLKWRKTSKVGFHNALQNCAGVIANGGFELSSECLQLGKKLLIKPLHGQFEQLSNAKTLLELDLCQLMMSLDVEAVEQWIEAQPGQAVTFPDDPSCLVDWLVQRDWHNTQDVCQRLWQQVEFPEKVQQKLKLMQS